jgi:hypothetical protein
LSFAGFIAAAPLSVASAKLDCGATTNKSIQLPRTIAIGTNPAGTGAHAIASALAANKILNRYGASVVKAETATGVKGETHVIGYPLHLASMTNVSDKMVYAMLKAWWDNLAELEGMHPLFKKWPKGKQALTNFTVPYHGGAVQFYKEVKMWTAAHDARSKEICR